MNNKNKTWESKKKLLEKLKKERVKYVTKHNDYVKQKEYDIKAQHDAILANGGIPLPPVNQRVVESPWSIYIKECDKKIKHVENSDSFKYAKKIAKGRKG